MWAASVLSTVTLVQFSAFAKMTIIVLSFLKIFPLWTLNYSIQFYFTLPYPTFPCMYALQLDQPLSRIRKSTIHLLALGFLLLASLDGLFAHQSHLVQDAQGVLLNPFVLEIKRKYIKKLTEC